MQFVMEHSPLVIGEVDLGAFNPEQQAEQVHRIATEEAFQTFDLANGPLLRVKLLNLGEEEHVLLWRRITS